MGTMTDAIDLMGQNAMRVQAESDYRNDRETPEISCRLWNAASGRPRAVRSQSASISIDRVVIANL